LFPLRKAHAPCSPPTKSSHPKYSSKTSRTAKLSYNSPQPPPPLSQTNKQKSLKKFKERKKEELKEKFKGEFKDEIKDVKRNEFKEEKKDEIKFVKLIDIIKKIFQKQKTTTYF